MFQQPWMISSEEIWTNKYCVLKKSENKTLNTSIAEFELQRYAQWHLIFIWSFGSLVGGRCGKLNWIPHQRHTYSILKTLSSRSQFLTTNSKLLKKFQLSIKSFLFMFSYLPTGNLQSTKVANNLIFAICQRC